MKGYAHVFGQLKELYLLKCLLIIKHSLAHEDTYGAI